MGISFPQGVHRAALNMFCASHTYPRDSQSQPNNFPNPEDGFSIAQIN